MIILIWPIPVYWNSIQLDRAQLTTEWLKAGFGSVILFAGVTILLEVNNKRVHRSAVRSLFAVEVTAPLRDALAIISEIRGAITEGATCDASDVCHDVSGTYDRVSAALPLLPSLDHTLLTKAPDILRTLREYDWRHALREFQTTTVWRAANVAEFQRMVAHLESLYRQACAIQPLNE